MVIINMHSNTTLVKVKYSVEAELFLNKCNSNTTLVKVKFKDVPSLFVIAQTFKYNSC